VDPQPLLWKDEGLTDCAKVRSNTYLEPGDNGISSRKIRGTGSAPPHTQEITMTVSFDTSLIVRAAQSGDISDLEQLNDLFTDFTLKREVSQMHKSFDLKKFTTIWNSKMSVQRTIMGNMKV
jgi:hypothetical protein